MDRGKIPDGDLGRIVGFVRRHHVMTLATVGASGRPWCAHIFYAWSGAGFVFTSGVGTRHGGEMVSGAFVAGAAEGPVRVAGGIALETRIVGRVQGLQIEGTVRRPGGAELEMARTVYLKRFPYAAVVDLELWVLEPTLMKLTDNTLGFGKKLIWTGGNDRGE